MSDTASSRTTEDIVAERIEELRTKAGWSYSELSRHMENVGVPIERSSLQKIERGQPRRKIGVNELLGFAEVFNVGINDLLVSTDDQLSSQFYSDLRDAQSVAWNYHQAYWAYVKLRERLVDACLDPGHGRKHVQAVQDRLENFRNQSSLTALMTNDGGETERDAVIQLLETVLKDVAQEVLKESENDG